MKKNALIAKISALVVAFSLGGALSAPAVLADERADQVDRQQQSQQKIDEVSAALEGINKELAQTILDLNQAQSDQQQAQADYDQASQELGVAKRQQAQVADQLEVATTKLEQLRTQIEQADQDRTQIKAEVAQIARDAYTSQSSNQTLELLTSRTTTRELSTYARNVSLASQLQQKQLSQVEQQLVLIRNQEAKQTELLQQIAELKEQADQALAAADQAAAQKEAVLSTLNETVSKTQQLQDTLNEQKASAEADLAAAQAEHEAAEEEIKKIDEANRKAAEASLQAQSQADGTGQGSTNGGSGSSGFQSGDIFQAPIKGSLSITSSYGYRIHPLLGTRLMHYGTDIASGCGDPQYAAADGTVFFTSYEGSGGNTVKINHGVISSSSWITVYRHMTQFAVSPGQWVTKGQLIGYTGATGNVTGCHVHFEIWKNGSSVNPMSYL